MRGSSEARLLSSRSHEMDYCGNMVTLLSARTMSFVFSWRHLRGITSAYAEMQTVPLLLVTGKPIATSSRTPVLMLTPRSTSVIDLARLLRSAVTLWESGYTDFGMVSAARIGGDVAGHGSRPRLNAGNDNWGDTLTLTPSGNHLGHVKPSAWRGDPRGIDGSRPWLMDLVPAMLVRNQWNCLRKTYRLQTSQEWNRAGDPTRRHCARPMHTSIWHSAGVTAV
jgi:hypothetical protein